MTTTSSTGATSGSAILTALGGGSGIDTAGLVKNLVSASFDPKDQVLTAKETANSAKVSSLATLNNGIDAFASALTTLIQGGTLTTQPTSSDSAVLTATAKPGASIGGLSAQLSVRQLAQAQSLVSGYQASAGAATGDGALTLQTASGSYTITLDSSNDTLSGLARTINAAGAGVTASVVTDANGARLAIKGATGAANGFTLTPASGADASLSAFAYPAGGGTGMTQAQAAQDAIVRLDGVDVTRATNTVDDLVDGVTLKLLSAAPTETVSLGASRPTEAIKQGVADFVSAYNELKGEIDTATAATTTASDGTTTTGPLYGNPAIRQMQQQLARLSSTVLNTAGGPSSLAEIGVSTNRDGTLTLDSTVLANQLASDPDGVEALFNPTQHASSPLIHIASAMGAAKPGTYQLANIVAATGSTSLSGTIAGVAGVTTGSKLYASVTSPASGLVLTADGDVASATVTVDLGLGGALQAIRDSLRASGGVLDSLSSQLSTEKAGLASQRAQLQTDETDYSDRLTDQFSTMNSRVAAYKSIQSYLTEQIAVWTKSSNG